MKAWAPGPVLAPQAVWLLRPWCPGSGPCSPHHGLGQEARASGPTGDRKTSPRNSRSLFRGLFINVYLPPLSHFPLSRDGGTRMNQPHDIHQTFQVVTCPHGSTLPAASLHREPLDQKRNPPSEFPGNVLSCVCHHCSENKIAHAVRQNFG